VASWSEAVSASGDAVVELIRAVVREELGALLGEFDSDPCWRVQCWPRERPPT
jgi:hypothetical protein